MQILVQSAVYFRNFVFHFDMVAIAQPVRAPDCGSGGRGFKSH